MREHEVHGAGTTELTRPVVSDGSLDRHGEELVSRYLLRIRAEVEARPALRETLCADGPVSEMRPHVLEILSDVPEDGTEAAMERAVDVFLLEHETQRTAAPARWLIDPGTGRATRPVTQDMVFTPPDFVGEDGKTHKSRPILHPGISSTMALAAHEKARMDELVASVRRNPSRAMALAHVTDPGLIVRMASERLMEVGIRTEKDLEGDSETVEFGAENPAGESQSMNPAFHRAASYAAVLATKVHRAVGGQGACAFGEVTVRSSSRRRWYEVVVKIRRGHPAEEQSTG